VPDDYLVGRVLAACLHRRRNRRVLASANDELTEELLGKLRTAGVKEIRTHLTPTTSTKGPFISNTLRVDETVDQLGARIAILRMIAAGRAGPRGAVETLFRACSSTTRPMDLVASRPDEGQQPLRAAPTVVGRWCSPRGHHRHDKVLVELRNGRGEIDDIDHLGNRRCAVSASWRRTSSAPLCVRVERAVRERSQAETENLMRTT